MSSTTPKTRRVASLTTASVVSVSLALLGGGVIILSGVLPPSTMSAADQTNLGSLLLASPIVILMLALIFEATRIALKTSPLPEPQPIGRLAPLPARRPE